VGHAQWRQTPVGLGFETHVGSLLWSMEYFRKGLWELPWDHFSLDWIRAFENGTYHHYAEPRHTTEALTEEAIEVMKRHVMSDEKKTRQPLFLYVAYTAAHAPLEPLQRDLHKCGHLSHSRRRHFCGLMVGLDRNVDRLAEESERILGSNTIFIFSSDNGGAVFFGGLNAPLRSGKTMPFGMYLFVCVALTYLLAQSLTHSLTHSPTQSQREEFAYPHLLWTFNSKTREFREVRCFQVCPMSQIGCPQCAPLLEFMTYPMIWTVTISPRYFVQVRTLHPEMKFCLRCTTV